MARVEKWKGHHVRIDTLERILNTNLVSLRTMFPKGDEDISIRLHRSRWEYYGIAAALEQIGLGGKEVVYINLR